MTKLQFLVLTITITIAAVAITLDGAHGAELYLEAGGGYKFDEPETFNLDGNLIPATYGSSISAIAEVGIKWHLDKKWSLKTFIGHHSQWSTGFPFKDGDPPEYYKSEIGIKLRYVILSF
jgi:hypothetical protein